MSPGSIAPSQQLDAIKANDEKALQDLYTANYKLVEKFVLQNSGTKDDAKDIFQEAFIATWRNVHLDKFTPTGEGSLNAYLFQIARFKWLDKVRSSNVKKTITLEEKHEQLMTFEEWNDRDTERLQLIRDKFRLLGDSCRELLTRFYYKKESLKDIAAEMNWTEATAKNNKYRCMERLRNMIINKA